MDIKVEIYTDRMVLTEAGRGVTVYPDKAYATRRLLVGSLRPAVDCLKDGLTRLGAVGLFRVSPNLEIHAREMAEGGLSEVEQRCLAELGYTAGAKKVEVVDG